MMALLVDTRLFWTYFWLLLWPITCAILKAPFFIFGVLFSQVLWLFGDTTQFVLPSITLFISGEILGLNFMSSSVEMSWVRRLAVLKCNLHGG